MQRRTFIQMLAAAGLLPAKFLAQESPSPVSYNPNLVPVGNEYVLPESTADIRVFIDDTELTHYVHDIEVFVENEYVEMIDYTQSGGVKEYIEGLRHSYVRWDLTGIDFDMSGDLPVNGAFPVKRHLRVTMGESEFNYTVILSGQQIIAEPHELVCLRQSWAIEEFL